MAVVFSSCFVHIMFYVFFFLVYILYLHIMTYSVDFEVSLCGIPSFKCCTNIIVINGAGERSIPLITVGEKQLKHFSLP